MKSVLDDDEIEAPGPRGRLAALLAAYPNLTAKDVRAALSYAAGPPAEAGPVLVQK